MPEMRERISQHRAERGESWSVVEEPIALLVALEKTVAPDRVVVVDCLTIWLSNLLWNELDYVSEVAKLAAWLRTGASPDHPDFERIGNGARS